MSQITDLTQGPPRSPRKRLGGYAVLSRTLDKGRALLAGKIGEYHYDCPVDNMLFGFKGVNGDQVKEQLQRGASDDQVLAWLNATGPKKTPDEISAWSAQVESVSFYTIPEKKDWFVGECVRVGIDPAKSTLFDFLDKDDKVTFKK